MDHIKHPAPRILGANLKRLRKAAGLSLTEVAKAYGGAGTYVSRAERGLENVRLDTLTRLASIFGKVGYELLLRPDTKWPAPPRDYDARKVLAENVMRLRQQREWSQSDLLVRWKKSGRSCVSVIERQKCNIALNNLQDLATALRVSTHRLLMPHRPRAQARVAGHNLWLVLNADVQEADEAKVVDSTW